MSANLEAMTLGKQGTLQTFTLNYFAWPPPKGGKNRYKYSHLWKKSYQASDWSCDIFTSEKNCMANEIDSHQRGTIFIGWVCSE